MGKQATQEETKIVKSMIQDEVAGWYLLKLPNEFYAAFWRSGIDCCHASGVAHGDYELSCAKTGTLGEVAVYIKEYCNKQKIEDPLNSDFYELPVTGLIAETLRSIKNETISLEQCLLFQIDYLENCLNEYQGSFGEKHVENEYSLESIALASQVICNIAKSQSLTDTFEKADYLRLQAVSRDNDESDLWDSYYEGNERTVQLHDKIAHEAEDLCTNYFYKNKAFSASFNTIRKEFSSIAPALDEKNRELGEKYFSEKVQIHKIYSSVKGRIWRMFFDIVENNPDITMDDLERKIKSFDLDIALKSLAAEEYKQQIIRSQNHLKKIKKKIIAHAPEI